MKRSFRVTLRGAGPRKAFPYAEIPFDSVAVFGTRARVPVRVTIGGVELRMSLAPMGGRHVLGFSGELAARAGIAVGDTVRIAIERDDAPRTVVAPPELARALRADARARAAWKALSYSHQREHAEAIRDARRPETRARRLASTLVMLTTTGKPAKPAPSARPLADRLRVTPPMKVVVHGAPAGFTIGVPTSGPGTRHPDVVILFANDRASLRAAMSKVERLPAAAALWIAYPKTTSRLRSDLTRDAGWDAIERAGYHAVTQVSIDDTWSALRFRRDGPVASME